MSEWIVRGNEPEHNGSAVARPVFVVLALAAAALYLSLFLRTNWQIGDEGTILHGAQRVLEGGVPSRDFFEVMGPGAFFSLALWFQLLGTSWLTSRIAILITSLASAWAIYRITSQRCAGPFSAFPAVLYTVLTVPLWPGLNHHFESNLWVLLAVGAAVARPRLDWRRGLLAGVLLGVSATIMPQKGLLIVAALALAMVLRSCSERTWRSACVPVVSIGVGFTLVGLLIVAFFWRHHALGDLFYANVIWPATQYHSVNKVPYGYGMADLVGVRTLLSLFPGVIGGAATAALLVPLGFIALLPALFALTIARRVSVRPAHRSLQSTGLTVALTGTALFVSESHRPDMMHLIYGSPLLLILVWESLMGSKSRGLAVSRRALAGCVALLAAVLAFKAAMPHVKVQTRRGVVQMRERDEALHFIQENVPRGEDVFVYPYYPMYYFLADVRNPTRYSILMYHMNTREQFDEVISALETKRVRYVLHDRVVAGENFKRWFPRYTHPSEDQQVLERYLAGHYRELTVTNRFRIMQRIEGPSPNGTD